MRTTMWEQMRKMQEQMDSMFYSFFSPDRDYYLPFDKKSAVSTNYKQPLADVIETDKEIIATIELPGIEKKDIDIQIKDDGIAISVEKKQESKDEKKGYSKIERSYSGFYRYISLPQNAHAEKADASYQNGVLELKIPKSKVEEKHKKIQIK